MLLRVKYESIRYQVQCELNLTSTAKLFNIIFSVSLLPCCSSAEGLIPIRVSLSGSMLTFTGQCNLNVISASVKLLEVFSL